LWSSWNFQGNIQHRLLQQPALGAQGIGVDTFVFQAERHIQYADVTGNVALAASRIRSASRQQQYGSGRERRDAGSAQE